MPRYLESDHPLAAWLEQHGESVPEFAERVGVSFSAIYSLIAGRTRKPLAQRLAEIQTCTGGEVTINQMLEWQRINAAKESA